MLDEKPRIKSKTENTAAISKAKAYPKSLALQQGRKRTSPDELTQVSDSGA
ncbi:hypothetical protein [Yersinia rohdei]|uniref:hypothetical protein n=1 Tax=Yersinia rohdei TaxID=29485 RepID=UPI001643C690|nr:hypothetical protein [Yersinia rohdei]